jgi:hypothetical protein
MAKGLTGTETRLAERYVRVLDFVSRCALAVDHGGWPYLWDKAHQLVGAAGRLACVADEARQDTSAGKPPPRTRAMRAAVAHDARHYRAGRLPHPEAGP